MEEAVPPATRPSPVSRAPFRPRNADAVGSLAKAFRIWARSFVPVSAIVLLVNVPAFVLLVLVDRGAPGDEDFDLATLPVDLLEIVLGSVSGGAVTYGVIERLRGAPVPAVAAISVGLRRVLPALGTSLLVGIAIVVGLVALIVPGVILMCGLAVAVPAAVVERTSGTSAMGRSWSLTKGAKGSIFLAYLLYGLFGGLVGFALTLGIGDASLAANLASRALELVIQVGLSSVFGAVLYHDLRVAKEGASVEDIARVFD